MTVKSKSKRRLLVLAAVAGMGLGLPMVASIVWSLGGTCRLINRNDRPGVAVELTVPVA